MKEAIKRLQNMGEVFKVTLPCGHEVTVVENLSTAHICKGISHRVIYKRAKLAKVKP